MLIISLLKQCSKRIDVESKLLRVCCLLSSKYRRCMATSFWPISPLINSISNASLADELQLAENPATWAKPPFLLAKNVSKTLGGEDANGTLRFRLRAGFTLQTLG